MREKILIADDDYLLRDLLCDILEKEEYQVIKAADGRQALRRFEAEPEIALVILDVMMPGMGGLEVLKKIRETSQVPVIILTALNDPKSELEGFYSGACDYVSKPFHGQVLLARIRAALDYKGSGRENTDRKRFGRLEVDLKGCRILVDGREAVMTNKEYQLFLYLMENKNIVLTRDQMLERIWGFDYEGDIRTIDTHIKMLRTDLGECGSYIRTVRGVGYSFEPEEDRP